MEAIIGIGIIISIIYVLAQSAKKRQQQDEDLLKEKQEQNHELFLFFSSKLEDIKRAVSDFEGLLNFRRGYFSNYELTVWLKQYSELYDDLITSSSIAEKRPGLMAATIDRLPGNSVSTFAC